MKQQKKKCIGCKKNMPTSKNKYCSWGCYARKMAPLWGLTPEIVKSINTMRESRMAAYKQ